MALIEDLRIELKDKIKKAFNAAFEGVALPVEIHLEEPREKQTATIPPTWQCFWQRPCVKRRE